MERATSLTVFLALSLYILVTLVSAVDFNFVTVNTKDGQVRGLSADVVGKTINTFLGIPYAKPPVGALRFKPPEAPTSWSGVRDALEPSDRCVQIRYKEGDNRTQSEDCLYLNIYTPSTSPASKLAVMVWVHGGSYRTGEGALYDGRLLATKDVVVVNFNYRLDALGFMSTEDDVMPGNYGMLDQVTVLKWVRDNIDAFGGDPQNVTIFGESAGSASVSLLVLSPLTKGLFKGAIMESGVCLDPWGYAHPGRSIPHRLATRLVAAEFGCYSKVSFEILRCLQAVDAEKLLNVTFAVGEVTADKDILMNPRVEQTYGFLPDIPIRLMLRGEYNHVNTIRGFNQHEWAIGLNLTELQMTATSETFTETARSWLTHLIFVDKDLWAQGVVEHYVHGISPDDHFAFAQADEKLGTDFSFVGGIIKEMDFAVRATKGEEHFLYEFAVRPEGSKQPSWVTAVHTDEIYYVFGAVLQSLDPKQRSVSETIMTLWTNFAKTGNPNFPAKPTTVWPPYLLDTKHMLNFTLDGTKKSEYDNPEVIKQYSELLRRLDTEFETDMEGGTQPGSKGHILKFSLPLAIISVIVTVFLPQCFQKLL